MIAEGDDNGHSIGVFILVFSFMECSIDFGRLGMDSLLPHCRVDAILIKF